MATPNDLRQMNRRLVLLASVRGGAATRSALAGATGLSAPTAGQIVDELMADGVLREAPPAATVGRGRPGVRVAVDDDRPRFLAVQLGPVNTRLAVLPVAPPGRDVWAAVVPTPTSLDRWTTAVAAAAGPLLGRRGPAAVLVSVPGVLDDSTGRTLLSPNVKWMTGQSVAAALSDAVRLPAHAVQEIRCLALGHRAVDPSADDFLLVDFGIGIGAAAVIGGAVSPLPFAGELGHTPVAGHSDRCGCGGAGCLETLVGRRRLFGPAGDDEAGGGVHRRPARAALSAAGLVIAGAMNTLGLGRAVLTGYAADLPADLLDVLRDRITGGAVVGRFGTVRVDAAPRHRLAGLATWGIDHVIAPG